MNKPNYRIYDRTGGGETEDIYAETLEDAITAGREWIEAGDWEQDNDEETLACGVGEIIYMPDLEPIESALTEYAVSYEAGRIVTYITATDLAAGDLDKIIAELANIATVTTDGTDADGDTIVVITPLAALDMIEDESATRHAEEHDCSGTLPAKDAPECLDGGDHDWRSPYSVLGGCKENPGVWGSGHGQVMIKTVCACCGLYRTVDYGATNSSNGTQTTRTSYEPADEASIAWLMRRLPRLRDQ